MGWEISYTNNNDWAVIDIESFGFLKNNWEFTKHNPLLMQARKNWLWSNLDIMQWLLAHKVELYENTWGGSIVEDYLFPDVETKTEFLLRYG